MRARRAIERRSFLRLLAVKLRLETIVESITVGVGLGSSKRLALGVGEADAVVLGLGVKVGVIVTLGVIEGLGV